LTSDECDETIVALHQFEIELENAKESENFHRDFTEQYCEYMQTNLQLDENRFKQLTTHVAERSRNILNTEFEVAGTSETG
jgi:hypothetical protein